MVPVNAYTDAGLIKALQSQQPVGDAVRFIYHAYYDFLSQYTLQNKGTEQDAEDIFQEVVVAFIELVKQDKFRGEASIKTFLYALNKNIWLNELKKRQRAEAREVKFETSRAQEEPDISQYIAGREAKKQILEIVGKLGDGCKKILLAFYYENQSMKEILKMSGFENEQVVRNKKYKCLKQLEQLLTSNPAIARSLKTALHYEL